MKNYSPSQSKSAFPAGLKRLYLNIRIIPICFFTFIFLALNCKVYCTDEASLSNEFSYPKAKAFLIEAPPCFILNCKDLTVTLGSGECGIPFNFIPDFTSNCTTAVNIQPLDTSLYQFGDFLSIGIHNICFLATDENGHTETCCVNVRIEPFPNPNLSLVCLKDIQYSLNQNCFATVKASDILSGGPYRCFEDYKVELSDGYLNHNIDRNPNLSGPQVGLQDIGKVYTVTIKDMISGNSCWTKITIEDKLAPVLICPGDITILCGAGSISPDCLGFPTVSDNCGTFSLSYYDDNRRGDCGLNYQELILRHWVAIDASGNKSSCVQSITIAMVGLSDVCMPLDYNDFDNPSLACDEKIIPSQDHSSHILPYPYCVDGYLLDSVHWFATGGFLPSPAGDLAGERLPRTLGWNCLDTGIYKGHPSPFPVYYPAHPEWKISNPVCWGPDEVVKWLGTGLPNAGLCINLSFNYVDLKIDLSKPNCDAGNIGCFKVLRQWTVMDWCTSQLGGHNQIIKVLDKKAPQILFPDSVLVTMEEYTCAGKWIVPKPWLTDNCSNDIHYYVTVESGLVLGDDVAGYIITGIKPGIWQNYIVAEDCCGNVSRHRFVINAQDLIPPSPICNKLTAVSLNVNASGENFAQIYAKDLNEASFDNCSHHVFFKVIRMDHLRGTAHGSALNQVDNGLNCAGINGDDHPSANGNQIYFDDFVRFCCNDVGKTIRVVLRVFDREVPEGPVNPGMMSNNGIFAGRFNDCMVEVEVQDKTLPTVQAPPNIVISCTFWFDIDKLKNPNDPTFGRVITDVKQRKKVITNDVVCHEYCIQNAKTGYPGYIAGASPSNPPASNKACDFYRVMFDTAHEDRCYDLIWGFDGLVTGACGTNFTMVVNDNRDCGQGTISRTIVATGLNGLSVTATQIIWVVDCDPFYINRNDNCDPNDDITWPGNCTGGATRLTGCIADINPDNRALGRPVIENNADDLCSLISIEYFDEIFTIEPDACFKVVRKWTVIDWCQYDPNVSATNGRWEYIQVIKVNDTGKPTIKIDIGTCAQAFKRPVNNICYAYLEITADATDNCSPKDWLFYDYKIDLYNDGKGPYSGFDYFVDALSPKEIAAGKTPYRRDNPLAVDSKNPLDASGTYPIGIHKICWYVEDGCGNSAASCKLFEIKDCKQPTPYCHVGLVTTVMPSSECITIWARDLDAGSFDNCTEAKDLKIYFEFTNSDSIVICCEDFENNRVNDELTIPVKICVEDEEGNKDCCRTAIQIQDPQDVCPNVGSNARITGAITNMIGEKANNVNVQLFESSNLLKQIITNSSGQYLFGDLSFGVNKEYLVRPKRNDDPMNGISTADIVKIQRHVLGLETLASPYQWIAADVNNSSTITASDISEIRKLVLGVQTEFDKMESWTFTPKNFVMLPNNPWNAPKEVLVKATEAKEYLQDFIAIKVGDVNNSARVNNINNTTTRNQSILQFEIDSHQLFAGELYKVKFRSGNFNDIIGFQFTLKFDPEVLSYEGYEKGVLDMDETNFGLHKKQLGLITNSWNVRLAENKRPDEVLFSLVFRSTKSANIGDILSLNSLLTTAEAYDSKMNIKDIGLEVVYAKAEMNSAFQLYQNTPNPFDKETLIHFELPEALPAILSIYDITGKTILTEEIKAKRGWNSIKIKKEDILTSGVYYYQLKAGTYSASKRMIVN